MRKKLILTVSLLAVGVALFVLSLVPGVSLIWEQKQISVRDDGNYWVWAQATIKTRGIFSLKEAKVTFKAVDADNNVLVEEVEWTSEENVTLKELYTVSFLNGIPPEDVTMEISDAEFDNVRLTVISSIIIVFSLIMTCFLVVKYYKERRTG